MARELTDAKTSNENVNDANQNANEVNAQELSIAVQDSWRSPGKPGDADNEISAPSSCRPENLKFPHLQIDGNVKLEKDNNYDKTSPVSHANTKNEANNIAEGVKTPRLDCSPPGLPQIQIDDNTRPTKLDCFPKTPGFPRPGGDSGDDEYPEADRTVSEELAQFWDILNKDSASGFGSQESREAIKDLFEKAKANGTMDSVIDSLENSMIGRGAYAIKYDKETGDLNLLYRKPSPADGFSKGFEKIDGINIEDMSGKGKDSPEYKELLSELDEAKKNGTLDTFFDDPANKEKLEDLIYGWFRSGADGRALDALNSDLEKMGTDLRFEVKRKLFEGDIMLMTVWFGDKEVLDGRH